MHLNLKVLINISTDTGLHQTGISIVIYRIFFNLEVLTHLRYIFKIYSFDFKLFQGSVDYFQASSECSYVKGI